jgi:hypothetical protein
MGTPSPSAHQRKERLYKYVKLNGFGCTCVNVDSSVFQQIDIADSSENGGGPALRMFGVTEVSLSYTLGGYNVLYLFVFTCINS